MSLDAEANDLKAYLTAAIGIEGIAVLDLDEIDGTPPANYVELHLAPRYGGVERQSGQRTTRGRRLTTRVAGSSVGNARMIEGRIATAFESRPTLDGVRVLVAYESGGGAFDKDGSWFTAASDWTYIH